jgi:integrase
MTEPTKKEKKARRTGHRKRLGPDKYLLRVFLLKDSEGKRRYYTETFHGKAYQAEDRIREILRRHRTGEPLKVSADSFGAVLDEWLEAQKHAVAEKTLRTYEDYVRLYLRPNLGGALLAQVTAADIQKLYNKLLEADYSRGTVGQCHVILGMVFRFAVGRRKLTGSPMAGVRPPRSQASGESEGSKAMTRDEVGKFLDAAKDSKLLNLYELAFHVGCRPGELLAVKWDDLDPKGRTVRIDQTIVWRKRGDWYLKPPKTKAGRRVIAVTQAMVDVLQAQRTLQLQARLKAGPAWKDHGFVFTQDNGSPWAVWNLYADFKRVLKASGLPWRFSPYTARHTVASLLMEDGANPRAVSDRLGHARIAMTLENYTHISSGHQADLSAQIEGLVRARHRISNKDEADLKDDPLESAI